MKYAILQSLDFINIQKEKHMKLKYKMTSTWFIMGIVWAAISVFLFFKYLPNTDPQYFLIRMISLVALPVLISIYYLAMPLITYANVTEDKIIIHKSIIIFNFKMDRKNIDYCRALNRDLVFYTKDDKVYTIHMDWVKKEELVNFIMYLQSFINVYEGNTKTKVNLEHLL